MFKFGTSDLGSYFLTQIRLRSQTKHWWEGENLRSNYGAEVGEADALQCLLALVTGSW